MEGSSPAPQPASSPPREETPPAEARIDSSAVNVGADVEPLKRQGDNDYRPENLVDGDPATAWVEGVKPGLGVPATLTFHLPEAAELTRVRIVNGYAKSRAHLLDNAAARRIRIQAGDGGFVAATLPRAQARTIAAPFGKARTVHITVLSGYRRDVDQDLAMSEVSFYARKG